MNFVIKLSCKPIYGDTKTRKKETPKSIELHFVDSKEDPTGLGEPFFPPVFAALANSLYKATGKRYYEQPFAPQLEMENLKM